MALHRIQDSNSTLCMGCLKLVHKQCSGVKGSLYKASTSFVCNNCKVYSNPHSPAICKLRSPMAI